MLCLLALALGNLAGRTLVQAQLLPLPPSVDAFYQPPADYSLNPLGTILRSRVKTSSIFDNSTVRVFQLLYRSQTARGVPSVGITTVFVPFNYTRSDKVVSLQTAYDSIDIECNPSYVLFSDPDSISEVSLLSLYVDQGWAVSIPDFEGSDAAFGNGVQAGYSTLDSVRAILNSDHITGIDHAAKVALVGGSGGAIGSEFALELSDQYAPELRTQLVGALLMALVPDANATIHAINGALEAGLVPLVLQGLAKQDDDFATCLTGALRPDQAAQFFAATDECGPKFAVQFAFRQIKSYLWSDDAVLEPTPQRTFHDLSKMGVHGRPSHPLFIYKGVKDTLSPIAATDELVEHYCSQGGNMIYERASNCDHGLASYGSIAGFQWLKDRLDDKPGIPGCRISNVTVPLDYVISHSGL